MFSQGEVQLQNNGDRTGMFEVFQIRGKLRPVIVFLPFPTNTTNCNHVDVIDLLYLSCNYGQSFAQVYCIRQLLGRYKEAKEKIINSE